jgi:ArsR family transcriptional regulator, arsenate/arsenite/antimonite-responsive transcriptional repressor
MSTLDTVLFAKALADETRQKIMHICCCTELPVSEIVEKLNVTQPTVSHHLAVLREAGLVNVREEGKQTFYSLNQERVAICCGGLVLKLAPETEMARAFKMVKIATGDCNCK